MKDFKLQLNNNFTNKKYNYTCMTSLTHKSFNSLESIQDVDYLKVKFN